MLHSSPRCILRGLTCACAAEVRHAGAGLTSGMPGTCEMRQQVLTFVRRHPPRVQAALRHLQGVDEGEAAEGLEVCVSLSSASSSVLCPPCGRRVGERVWRLGEERLGEERLEEERLGEERLGEERHSVSLSAAWHVVRHTHSHVHAYAR